MSRILVAMVVGLAQAAAPAGSLQAQDLASRDIGIRQGVLEPRRNQFSLGVGIVAGELTYARRVSDSRLHFGGGVWGAWEAPSSFERNIWEPIGATALVRHHTARWLHADLGLTAARYVWADDCSECSGWFVGIRSGIFAGYRFLFGGPELAVGRASDDRHGGGFGAIWGAQVRLLLAW